MYIICSENIPMRRCPCPVLGFAPSSIMIRSVLWMFTKPNFARSLCAYRIFLPFVGITVSSRESARFRNGIVKIAATRVSAGVSTGVGDHESKYTGKKSDEVQGDEQFEIDDSRSLDTMYRDLAEEGLQPVLNEYLDV